MPSEEPAITYTFKNPRTGQAFSIHHAYLLYDNFFTAVSENPKDSPYELYDREVLQSVNEACFENAELAQLDYTAALEWTPAKREYEQVTKQIARMNTEQLNDLFEEALVKSSDLLPSDQQTNVCIFPENEAFPSEMLTVGSEEILVFYSKYDRTYKAGMAHEYHHTVWLGKHIDDDTPLTLFDHLALEGQAVMFESIVYPDMNSTYYIVDESYNQDYWDQMVSKLDSIYTEDIDGTIQGGINGLPHAYGYSEGYKIIRAYLEKHPDMSVEEWTSKDPREIFEDSKYVDNYQ
ncbi:hypothetical protein NCCP2716_27060 [Sporosarcina sp. NCCP-2716]|uniref:DUF2268 domain-containing putative Zn-dependent protease n=1 Tax=Sporosarcina sp. NCCP-2716 TaxID=2943679 RepID=UPI00203B1276|nr:DUF2268 domain-containing putative Zn-dependent protease [Sporosarcina sp. NCCP-2716]GKV70208.1 hypothetical protein NCCP2716_27060 [Sporosarcina sp. NCCP-2716]